MLPPSRASMVTTCIIIAENVVHVHPVSLVPSIEARKCFNLIRVCSIGVFGRSMRPCALLFDVFCSSHASLSLCVSFSMSLAPHLALRTDGEQEEEEKIFHEQQRLGHHRP